MDRAVWVLAVQVFYIFHFESANKVNNPTREKKNILYK
jgi:hypothetical protein